MTKGNNTMRSFQMDAGEYFIGDLSYVIMDAWGEFCDLIIDGPNVKDGKFKLKDGREFVFFSTAFGDGFYTDDAGKNYSVDAGLIGAIKVTDIKDQKASIGLGNIYNFATDWHAVEIRKGVMNFGGVNIDTATTDKDAARADSIQQIEIIEAVKNGDDEAVQTLLDDGADANDTNLSDETPLYIAAEKGYKNIVAALLAKGADINRAGEYQQTPLYIAAQNGHADIVELLLDKGAAVNKANINGSTPLYSAAADGYADIVAALLANGADINQQHNSGATPLYIAAQKGHATIVQLLLAQGADIHQGLRIDINSGETPFFAAVGRGRTAALEVLLANGSDVNQLWDGATALFIAAQDGQVEIAKLLLMQPDINISIPFRSTKAALTDFTQSYSSDIQQRMEKFIAEQNNPDDIEMLPIDIASVMGHQNIVLLLEGHTVTRALAGDVSAQKKLANSYENGEGVDKDEEKSFYWFSKAAEQGDAYAMYMLAMKYPLGKGTEKNEQQAFY
jgi:ankyrin repeat protein